MRNFIRGVTITEEQDRIIVLLYEQYKGWITGDFWKEPYLIREYKVPEWLLPTALIKVSEAHPIKIERQGVSDYTAKSLLSVGRRDGMYIVVP